MLGARRDGRPYDGRHGVRAMGSSSPVGVGSSSQREIGLGFEGGASSLSNTVNTSFEEAVTCEAGGARVASLRDLVGELIEDA